MKPPVTSKRSIGLDPNGPFIVQAGRVGKGRRVRHRAQFKDIGTITAPKQPSPQAV